MTPPDRNHKRQSSAYHRRVALVAYFTGGLGGMALLAADYIGSAAFVDAHPWLRAVFLTSALSTGALLGLAYGQYQWAATKLDRRIEDCPDLAEKSYDPSEDPDRPGKAELFYRCGSLGVPFTGLWLLVIAWADAVARL